MTNTWLIPLAITIAAVWLANREDRRWSRDSFGYAHPGATAVAVISYICAIIIGAAAWYAWSLFA